MKKLKITLTLTLLLCGFMTATAVSYKGDVNGDGKVDMADMAGWSRYRQTAGADIDTNYDLNKNGKLDDNDLEILANLIINMKLVENTGMDVGIGGWNEDDEDYGGSVGGAKKPYMGSTAAGFSLQAGRTYFDYSSHEIVRGMNLHGGSSVVGVLVDIKLGAGVSIDPQKLSLSPDILGDHKIIGTPVVISKEWLDNPHLRFIVYSPSLTEFSGDGELFTFNYTWDGNPYAWEIQLSDCQGVGSDDTTVSSYYGDTGSWMYTYIQSLKFREDVPAEGLSMEAGERRNLGLSFNPDNATNKDVVATSTNESVAVFDVQTQDVVALSAGVTVITVSSADNPDVSCSVKITVSSAEVKVTEITIVDDDTSAPFAGDLEVLLGGGKQLKALVMPDDATDKAVTWSSGNTEVVSIDDKGYLTALALGETDITATANDGSDISARLHVKVMPVPAESISLNQTAAQLMVGQSTALVATVLPEDATDKTVSWTSSNPSVATVDSNGKVTALALGEATITASCGEATATCAVSVVATPVTGITLDITTASLKVGETITIIPTVLPEDATDKTVNWTSSNPSVATVDSNGKVTALALGTATITATCGGATATCAVSVVATPVTGITLDITTASLKVGETITIIPTVLPEDATDKTVNWTSSNPSVATVDSNGKVTALALGTATITASCGGATATCAVSVVATPVTGITLDITTASLKVGETITIIPTVFPENATDKTVTWTSSNPSVATVDSNGKVTALALGTATITATCGGATATCAVSVVTTPVTGITLDITTASLKVGETIIIIPTVLPEDATDKTVTWTSSNPAVATVDAEGCVTALSPGTAVITAACGGASATCVIEVTTDLLIGDADGNGIIDANDAVVMTNYYTGVIDETGIYLEVSDINNDGVIDSQDALLATKIYLDTLNEH